MQAASPSQAFTFRRRASGAAAPVLLAAAALLWAVCAAPARFEVQALLCCAAAGVLSLFLTAVTEESLEVVEGVGVVLRARRRGGGARCALIDAERIRAVLINESVDATDVRFYLALALHDAPELAVAFPTLAPRLDELVPVYRAVQRSLERGCGAAGRQAAEAAAGGGAALDS